MRYFGSSKLKKLFNDTAVHLKLKENGVFGWGRKKSFFKAKSYAEKHNLNVICLEDGFIRSLGLGKEGYDPLSLVVDETGIYFDAYQASDLENLIVLEEKECLNLRAKKNIHTIISHGITKYNQKFEGLDTKIFATDKKHILVVDQTFGDQSIKYAGAETSTFKKMLKQAIYNHPNAIVWVKIHPDVLAKKSQGHFNLEDLKHPQVKVLTQNFNPIELLKFFQDVYVVSSQLGFEALLCGKKVHCFGVPWYAGWGLTIDDHAPLDILQNRRNVQRSLTHLFACAYLEYARYVSPVSQQACELEDILELLIPNIKTQKHFPTKISAYGFSPWKKKFIADFLNFPRTKVDFYSFFKPNKDDVVLAWGKKAHLLKNKGYKKVITVEDGFIRSVGLGAKLIRPCSLVFDDVGIYYDATRPSRLENLLKQSNELTPDEYTRAKKLISLLIDFNITKYNVGLKKQLTRPIGYKKVILVIGQVEDDMSIQLGGVGIKTNLSLLQEVRAQNPDAFIIYKPHPDVVAGLRIGLIPKNITQNLVNCIEENVSILDCFTICDEVHTISSLSGFEALLRGLNVYCYGLPFYAGWGLTQDRFKCERRNVQISLEVLVYCTLIEYSSYNLSHIKSIPNVYPEVIIEYFQKTKSFPHSYLKSGLFNLLNSHRKS